MASHNLAPVPDDIGVERRTNVIETKVASNPHRRGPLCFEEGLIRGDYAILGQMYEGVGDGELVGPGPNAQRAAPYHRQSPQTTTGQRARMGGAEFHTNQAWVTAPALLGEFANGTSAEGEQVYLHVDAPGVRVLRRNEAEVR
jgi:hypothetical protein